MNNEQNAILYQTILGQAEAEGKSQLEWEWVNEQKDRYKGRADKFNRQHEVLTGQQHQDDSPWATPLLPGLNGASSTTKSIELPEEDYDLAPNVSDDEEQTLSDKESPSFSPLTSTTKYKASIPKEDQRWFTSDSYWSSSGRKGKGFAGETAIKPEKIDDFMSMAFDPSNFSGGKIDENSYIYKLIQDGKKGGSRRMKRLESSLKQYAQAINNMPKMREEGYNVPTYINKLIDRVKKELTTTKRFYK